MNRRHNTSSFFARFALSKRQRYALTTIILTAGLLATQLVSFDKRLEMVLGLSAVSYLTSAWALREDLGGVEWITLLILPTMYTASVAVFYFLLPVRWLTRLPTAFIFAVGMYALLLTENIYNVAAERSIQLVRAAHSIGLLLTLMTAFLFFNTLFSFRLPFYQNGFFAGLIAFPLILQALWSVYLSERSIPKSAWFYTFGSALLIIEAAIFLSFWPVKGSIASLYLTALLYTLVGIGQQRILERLFKGVLRELIIVSSVVFVLMLLATRWGG